MALLLIIWTAVGVLGCLALFRAAARPEPDFHRVEKQHIPPKKVARPQRPPEIALAYKNSQPEVEELSAPTR